MLNAARRVWIPVMLSICAGVGSATEPGEPKEKDELAPEVAVYNQRLFELLNESAELDLSSPEIERRWGMLRDLLALMAAAGYERDAFDDETAPCDRPEGSDASRLLLLEDKVLDPAAWARRERVRAAVDRLRSNGFFAESLPVLQQGPFIWPKPAGLIIEAQWPELVLIYDAGRLCLTMTELAADTGDMDAAVDHLRAALGFAEVISTQPSALGALVATELSQRASELVPRVLGCGGEPPVNSLKRLQRDFFVWTQLPWLEYAFNSERILALQVAEFVHVADEAGEAVDVERLLRIADPDRASEVRGVFEKNPITRQADLDDANRFWDGVVAIVQLPAPMRVLRAMNGLEELYEFVEQGRSSLRITVPGMLRRLINSVTRSQTLALGAAWGIAAYLHAARHGEVSATLEQIDQEFQCPSALDPFIFPPGAPLQMVIREVETGRVVIYSTGIDGTDNGGRPLEDGDATEALFHPRADGFDAILIDLSMWPRKAGTE